MFFSKKVTAEPCPVVCCVGEDYIICIPLTEPSLVYVKVGKETFTCDDNCVVITDEPVLKFQIPRLLLDQAGSYTVLYANMGERVPYRPSQTAFLEKVFTFSPVSVRYPTRIAVLSDVHGMNTEAAAAGTFFQSDLDLLILNGDISSSSQSVAETLLPFRLAFTITRGQLPVIITRGNHDLRGKFAPKLKDLYLTDNGKMYYTVRFPTCEFLVLDCGEDKTDDHPEYGGTAAFHSFRLRETEYLRCLDRSSERSVPGVVLSHIPFPHLEQSEEFRIEERMVHIGENAVSAETCVVWAPSRSAVFPRGDHFDCLGIGCQIVIGGLPEPNAIPKNYIGTFMTLYQNLVKICFADAAHRITEQTDIDISDKVQQEKSTHISYVDAF